MNYNYVPSYPGATLLGIRDLSKRNQSLIKEERSIHTPLFFVRTIKGPEELTFISSDEFDKIYDMDSLNPDTYCYNHQSHYLSECIKAGNGTIAIQRVITPTDDILTSFGFVVRNGAIDSKWRVPTDTTTGNEFLTFIAPSKGVWGGLINFVITAAPESVQATLGVELGCFIYQLTVYYGTGVDTNLVSNKYSESYTYFTLKPDSISTPGVNYYINNILNDSYTQYDDSYTPSIGKVVFNPDVLIGTMAVAGVTITPDDLYNKNIFATLPVAPEIGPVNATNRFLFNEDLRTKVNYFSVNGSNLQYQPVNQGMAEDIDYNNKVVVLLKEFLQPSSPFWDIQRYPISTIWDSGFSSEVKELIAQLLRVRPDIYVTLSTFIYLEIFRNTDGTYKAYYPKKLRNDELVAAATNLRSMLSLIPESMVFNTACCRGMVIMHNGINQDNGKYESLSVDIMRKIVRMCGSTRWDSALTFDQNPLNLVEGFSQVDYTYQTPTVVNELWDAGIINVQSNTTSSWFYPVLTTVYPDKTSVLNSIFMMITCCEVQKVLDATWRRLTGNSKLSKEKLIELSNTYIMSDLKDRYDSRFVIVPDTQVTAGDEIRGYSWTTAVNVYAENMKVRGVYEVRANRMSSLTQDS